MASLTMLSFNMRLCPSSFPTRLSYGSAQLVPLNKASNSLRLSSSYNISGSHSVFSQKPCTITTFTQRPQSVTVFAAKGYKMKTHKVNLSLSLRMFVNWVLLFKFCAVNVIFIKLILYSLHWENFLKWF